MKKKKEKQLTNFSIYDKKDFIKFVCIMGSLALLDIFALPAMIVASPVPSFVSIPTFAIATLAVGWEQLGNYGEGFRNYILSKKYKAKYYKEMEEKIERVEDYIYVANQASQLYFEIKNKPSTPSKFLNEIRMGAYEKALQAQMIINIHNHNLTPNQKYFNDLILEKQKIVLSITTHLPYFDLTENKVVELKQYYKELECKLKHNCDVRQLIEIEKYQKPKYTSVSNHVRNITAMKNSASNVKTNNQVKTNSKDFEM